MNEEKTLEDITTGTSPVEPTEQDSLKVELERVQKTPKSEIEKATYSLTNTAKRIKELGGDPASILGMTTSVSDDDDAPVTVGMLKKLEHDRAAQSALQLAEAIPNETERELTKFHLENTIRSSGNPSEDLKIARSIVNAAKNQQITEELIRKPQAKTYSSSSGAPARAPEPESDLTKEELSYMKAPFNLSREQVLASRKK